MLREIAGLDRKMKSNSLWLVFQLACLGCEKAPASTHPGLSSSTALRTNEALPASSSSASLPASLPEALTPNGFETPLPELYRNERAPCKRYAALSSAACKAAIQTQNLPVKPALGKTSGIETPLQLIGPLNGVTFELPRGLYGFLDCRLVLMLDDLAKELASFGIVAIQVNNTYRPQSVLPPKTPSAQGAKTPPTLKRGQKTKAKAPPVDSARLSQHAKGLAIDITDFRFTDGRTLNVERDFHGTRAAPPCGPKAHIDASARRVAAHGPGGARPRSAAAALEPVGAPHASATLLRDITCAIARAGFCNHLITPNRDAAHANHLHCDIEAKASEVTVE